jgi:hypothetical protein
MTRVEGVRQTSPADGLAAAGPRAAAPEFAGAIGRAIAALDRSSRIPSGRDAADGQPESLLAAQAALYREAETVELAARLVDHAVGAIKTVLQTRV